MAKWKEGDLVRVVKREVTPDDRKTNRYFQHMAGLVGTVQSVYNAEEVSVKIDLESLSSVARDVHTEAVSRMRTKFLSSIGEEQKSKLTPEERNFGAHYVLLTRSDDLEKA